MLLRIPNHSERTIARSPEAECILYFFTVQNLFKKETPTDEAAHRGKKTKKTWIFEKKPKFSDISISRVGYGYKKIQKNPKKTKILRNLDHGRGKSKNYSKM